MSTGRRADLRGAVRTPDGARLAYQVTGPYDAPALLLLPGQANHHGWWDRLRGDFDEHLVVTFDWRGTGRTSAPLDGGAWSTASFADDAAAVLAGLGHDRADVYGTSMGGRVAQELALRHPGVVRRLVLACTSPGGSLAQERDRDVRRALADPDRAQRRRTTFDLFYTPGWVAAHGGHDHAPRDLLGDPTMSPESSRRHLRVSAGHDASERLGDVAAPTLVLHGTDDRMVPTANAPVIADAVPGARLHLVEGGRHGFFDEMRAEVVGQVRGFLAEGP